MASIEQFIAAEGDGLVRYAFFLTRDADSAQDVAQTILARLVARGIDDLVDPGSYARRAVLNEVRSIRRRSAAHLRALARLGPAPAEVGPTAAVERIALWSAMRGLSQRHRAALILRYYEGRSDAEIGKILNCSPATVRSLVSRALKHLRKRLPGEGQEG